MSKKPNSKREIIPLDEVPRSRTPEPASKRQRTSRSTSKTPVPDSSRSEESGVREIGGVKVSKAGATESSSIVRPARTLAPTLSSDQPASVAMAHLSVARSSTDPADRRILGEADTAARPAIVAVAAPDSSDHRTSGEADAEDERHAIKDPCRLFGLDGGGYCGKSCDEHLAIQDPCR